MKVCTLASISPQFQPSTMCYVETVYHLVRVSGRTIFDLDARLGRSTVSTCGIGKGRDPGEMKASVHVVTTVCHVRGVRRSRRPCIAVCLRNPLSSRPCLQENRMNLPSLALPKLPKFHVSFYRAPAPRRTGRRHRHPAHHSANWKASTGEINGVLLCNATRPHVSRCSTPIESLTKIPPSHTCEEWCETS